MSPVEPESSSSSENQAKPNTIEKKKEALGVTRSLWRGGSRALLPAGCSAPAFSWGCPNSPVQTPQTWPRRETWNWLGFYSCAFWLLAVLGSGVCRMEDREELLCFAWELGMSFNLLSVSLSPYYTQSPVKMLFKSTCGSLYQDYNTRSIPLNNSSGTLQQSLACGSILELYGEKKGGSTT